MAVCGNGLIEPGEQCDCGQQCTPTSCCASNCTINTAIGAVCSPQDPTTSPCCSSLCQFVPAATNQTCSAGSDCAQPARCDGSSAACPSPPPNGKTVCNCLGGDCSRYPLTANGLCDGGQCNVSICAAYNASAPCFLAGTASCEVCGVTYC